MGGVFDWLLKTPGKVFGVQQNVPADAVAERGYERTGNFREGPRYNMGDTSGGRGSEVAEPVVGEDPMEQLYIDSGRGAYRVGSEPELEQQLAASLGWSPDSGQGLYEFLSEAAGEGVRWGVEFVPGGEVSGEDMQRLLLKVGVDPMSRQRTDYQAGYEQVMGR